MRYFHFKNGLSFRLFHAISVLCVWSVTEGFSLMHSRVIKKSWIILLFFSECLLSVLMIVTKRKDDLFLLNYYKCHKDGKKLLIFLGQTREKPGKGLVKLFVYKPPSEERLEVGRYSRCVIWSHLKHSNCLLQTANKVEYVISFIQCKLGVTLPKYKIEWIWNEHAVLRLSSNVVFIVIYDIFTSPWRRIAGTKHLTVARP